MKTAIALGLAALTGLAASTAPAAPIVAAGSSYSIFLADEAPAPTYFANVFFQQALFDGIAQDFVVQNQNYRLAESQSDLGGGRHLIHVELSSDSDMSHAVAGGAGALDLGLGVNGDGLDLTRLSYLDQAIMSLDTTQGSFVNDHLASDYRSQYFSGAWGGRFPDLAHAFVTPGAEPLDIRALRMDFYVSELPEPGSPALVALALAGAGWVARRRRTR